MAETIERLLAVAREHARTLDRVMPDPSSGIADESSGPARWSVPFLPLRALVSAVLSTGPGRHVQAFPLPEEEDLARVEAACWAAGRAYYSDLTGEVPSLPTWEGLREETQREYVHRATRVVDEYARARARD